MKFRSCFPYFLTYNYWTFATPFRAGIIHPQTLFSLWFDRSFLRWAWEPLAIQIPVLAGPYYSSSAQRYVDASALPNRDGQSRVFWKSEKNPDKITKKRNNFPPNFPKLWGGLGRFELIRDNFMAQRWWYVRYSAEGCWTSIGIRRRFRSTWIWWIRISRCRARGLNLRPWLCAVKQAL